MKKTLLVITSIFSFALVHAQEPADALRFSWTVPGGTARNQAVGGAMGSLGGDVSAAFVNPAGLAFYRTGDLIFTPYYRFQKNKSSYLGRTENDKDNNFTFGTTGFVIGSGQNKKGNNVAFTIAYNRAANFGNNVLYRGKNNKSSYTQKFLEEIRNANEKDPNNVASNYPFGTSLAFNTYVIDTVGGTQGSYQFQSRAAKLLNTGLLQENAIEQKGGINEFVIGAGVDVNQKLMVGGTFGVDILNYERNAAFTEQDATLENNNFDYFTFSEKLKTSGAGINAKLGLIYRPVDRWRLGLAFHSPTVYNLTDNYFAEMIANTEGYKGTQSWNNEEITGEPSVFKYMLITPYKAIASASYVLREIEDITQQKGFLTADVEYVNYKASSYHTDPENVNTNETDTYLKQLNEAIDKAYKGSFNFKVGGELKFTTFMVRAGAAYFGNPYRNINGEKGHKLNLSAGLGYRNKGKFIDVTYVHAMNKDVNFPYRLQYSAYSGANVKSSVGNVMATIGFKF